MLILPMGLNGFKGPGMIKLMIFVTFSMEIQESLKSQGLPLGFRDEAGNPARFGGEQITNTPLKRNVLATFSG